MRIRTLFVALALISALSLPARTADRLGIVLIHGKSGVPQQLTPLAQSLAAQGWLTEQPEMCWSRSRIYDQLYLVCLREIDAAVGRLKQSGAVGIVVLGMSLGGNAALAYGARNSGLKGIVTLVPGHAPEFIGRRPEIIKSLERARTLLVAGMGNIKTNFADVNTRTTSFNLTVTTTPEIYISFFGSESQAVMPANAERLSAPLLYVAAANDPTQRGRGYIFDRVPSQPLNRYITVDADHIDVPAVSHQIVVNWLKELSPP